MPRTEVLHFYALLEHPFFHVRQRVALEKYEDIFTVIFIHAIKPVMAKSTDITALASGLRATLSTLKRRLRERGSVGDFTPSQTDVLRQLDRDGPATVSKLAREIGMRPQSIGAIVATLQAEKLVSCTPDPDDGRQTLVALTPLCRNKIAKGRAALEDWLASRIRQLSPEEQAHLAVAVAILRRISEN